MSTLSALARRRAIEDERRRLRDRLRGDVGVCAARDAHEDEIGSRGHAHERAARR